MDSTAYKATVAATFNRAAASYDRLGVEFFTPMGQRLVDRARPKPGDRVLDVGCGRGACVFPAAAAVGPSGHILGIDIAPAMVDEVTSEATRLGIGNVEARVMDGENPDLPARSFDLVIGSYSVIFFPDAPGALPRYARLLAGGGRLAFTSPVFRADTFPFLPPVFTELIPQSLLRHLPPEWHPERLRQRFNSWLGQEVELDRTLRQAGFTDVEVVDEPVNMTSVSGEAWVNWSHTQGMQLLWQHLPEAETQWLHDRLVASLDAMRGHDGRITIEVPVRFVIGRTAG